MKTSRHTEEDLSRIVEMAWEDRTPFEAIEFNYGLNEHQLIQLMRSIMQPSSFRMWRKRMSARKTKHLALRSPNIKRFRCPSQNRR